MPGSVVSAWIPRAAQNLKHPKVEGADEAAPCPPTLPPSLQRQPLCRASPRPAVGCRLSKRVVTSRGGTEGRREGTRLFASLLSAEVFFQPEATDNLSLEKRTRNRKQNWKDLMWSPSPSPCSKVRPKLHGPHSCSPGLTCLLNSPDGAGRDYPEL